MDKEEKKRSKISLSDLFSDSGPFDRQKVLEVLYPILTIQKSSNRIYFKDIKLNARQRVLAFALAKKLLKAEKIIDDEMVTAVQVSKETGLKQGTVDPAFKELKEKGFLVGKAKYEIPVHQVSKIINLLTIKGKSHEE